MPNRKKIPPEIVADITTESRRRCCLCFGLKQDNAEKKGQIAHLDHDPSNNAPDNLAFSIQIKVEATTIETNDSALRRQSLSRHGFTYSFGPIRKNSEQIVSEPEMMDLTGQYEQWADLAFQRYLLKAGKYDRTTAVLVHLDIPWRLPMDARSNLLRKTEEHLSSERPRLYGVYYCYNFDYVIDGIRSKDVG